MAFSLLEQACLSVGLKQLSPKNYGDIQTLRIFGPEKRAWGNPGLQLDHPLQKGYTEYTPVASEVLVFKTVYHNSLSLWLTIYHSLAARASPGLRNSNKGTKASLLVSHPPKTEVELFGRNGTPKSFPPFPKSYPPPIPPSIPSKVSTAKVSRDCDIRSWILSTASNFRMVTTGRQNGGKNNSTAKLQPVLRHNQLKRSLQCVLHSPWPIEPGLLQAPGRLQEKTGIFIQTLGPPRWLPNTKIENLYI